MNKITKVAIVLLAVALLTPTIIFAQSNDSVINVNGTASVKVMPDIANFTISINEKADTSLEAQKKTNEKMAQIRDILKTKYNTLDKDIITDEMNISPNYQWLDGKQVLIGQSAFQSIMVTINSLDDIASIIDSLSIVQSITISSISFDKKDKNAQMQEARKLAALSAKTKAQDYATAFGVELGNPLTITDNSGISAYNYPVLRPNVVMARGMIDSAEASADYNIGEISVTASVSVTFALKVLDQEQLKQELYSSVLNNLTCPKYTNDFVWL